MDKKVLKEFAIMARRELIDEVKLKANNFGLNENSDCKVQPGSDYVMINGNRYHKAYGKAYEKLVEIKKEKGFDELIEEVAYTWFNRFIALRFMEVNDYLPSHIRVLSSSVEGKVDPDILEQYKECDLDVDSNEIDLLISNGNIEGAYRKLLIAQCNKLSQMMPFLFEEINDYTEMLLPDKLLIPQSIIKKLVNTISEADFREQVEIIGWIYQYYISEKKDKVFADLKKNIKVTKENIPAATQLFTPDWIVKYMVENSLGRLWLEGHPNKELQSSWKYYLEEAEQEPEVLVELEKIKEEHSELTPQDIKVLDPCMGSGHILVYAFDVLYQIYLSAGYSEKDIPRLILENNIYGLDIDDRAAQLAGFALIMKARSYSKRFFRDIEKNSLELNVCAIQESRTLDAKGENQISGINEEEIEYFANGDLNLKEEFEYLVEVFTDAKEYGSILEVQEVNFEVVKQRLDEIETEDNLMFGDYRKMLLDKLPAIIRQAEIMNRKYEVCITNPPYLTLGKVDIKLNNYVSRNYKLTKNDLFSVMIDKSIKFTKDNYFISMIVQHTWINSNNYKPFREMLLESDNLKSLVYLGTGAFEEINGEVVNTAALVLCKSKCIRFKPKFIDLIDSDNKEKSYYDYKNLYSNLSQEDFKNIPKFALAYKATKSIINILNTNDSRLEVKAGRGLQTGDDDIFLRLWSEVNIDKTNILEKDNKKWFLFNKGGMYRKWYGNNEWVVLWENNGAKIKKMHSNGTISATLRNLDTFFSGALTYTYITGGKFNGRYCNDRYCYSGAGAAINSVDNYYILGFYNSNVFMRCIQCIKGNTIRYEVGDIESIPIITTNSEFESNVRNIVRNNIELCKDDWDSYESSWDFKTHPLVKVLTKSEIHKLSSVFSIWEKECQELFKQLKINEEELNRIFIEIYGLQDELTPEVEDKAITIRKADSQREIRSFISYFVGCMFGRYSIDAEGLIYAGGEFKDKWNFKDKKVRKIEKDEDSNIISDLWGNTTFLPDSDNVIPITENEYFEDDIVSRFIEFVKTVYGEETLNENLDFIAETLVKKNNETSKQRIRRYFMDEFFIDHCKVYQKRPIYWLIDSGKNKGFKALIYLHRYNKETLANVRLNYLLELQGKYINEEKQIERYLVNGNLTPAEKKKYTKDLQVLSQKQNELVAFDKVVDELANKKIELDLDDGVVKNYEKLQPILAKIK